MKKAKRFLIPLLIVIVLLGSLSSTGAANGTPGSEADPVVTKSYVDKTVKEAAEKAALSATEKAMENASNTVQEAKTIAIEAAEIAAKQAITEDLRDTVRELMLEALPSIDTSEAAAFRVVNVKAGKTLTGKSGTEIILRSGSAKAVAKGTDGLADVTAGKDLAAGKEVDCNHLLICPRDDGRGILAVTDTWIMVRGEYTVQ